MNSQALSILQTVFGYDAFRGRQAEIIDTLVDGGDCLVLMPTGGGKSLCYQIPALVRNGVAVVISPLIALMQDQVNALGQLGISAAFLNSTLAADEVWQIEEKLRIGEIKLLYIAPERLLQPRTFGLLKSLNLSLFAIDEAHCVSQWGHDFRSDYLQLEVLHQQFPTVPRIALTATADKRTRQEIIDRLDLGQAAQFIEGFDRPNIQYRIEAKQDPRKQLLRFLRNEHPEDAGIVYCLSRRKVDETADWLSKQGFRALPYHAGLPPLTRQQHQDRFLREEGLIIVATIAFGMGIDKPDVRFVAHLDLPKSVEAYYQETGRAGRDGEPATAWMVYGVQDVIKLKQMLDQSQGNEQHKRVEQQRLNAMLGLCEITSCRRQSLLHYFGETLETPCGNCDTCLTPVATFDGTVAAQKALSCCYRSGQRFGVNHLIDILLGKDNAKIRQFNHHQLSTYGIGKELNEQRWRSVYRQLTARGYVEVDHDRFGALVLTDKCRPLLRGEEKLELRDDPLQSGSERKTSARRELQIRDEGLWQRLRTLRKQLADEQGVPPFMIFHDATLMEMVDQQPRSLQAMSGITGVGQAKLEHYGEPFVEAIIQHLNESAAPPRQKTDTRHETLTLLKEGLTPEAIAESRGLAPSTVYGHLAHWIESSTLELTEALSLEPREIDLITDALLSNEEGLDKLKPVYDMLAGAYDYGILRCVRAYIQREMADEAK